MDIFTSVVTVTQGGAYALNLGASLANLYEILKHGPRIFKEYRSGVRQLQSIVIRLTQQCNIPEPAGLWSILTEIKQTTQRLLKVFAAGRRLRISLVLLTRRTAISEDLAVLERQKTTLLLFFAVEAVAPAATPSGRLPTTVPLEPQLFGTDADPAMISCPDHIDARDLPS